MSEPTVLLIVAMKTDQPNIERRLRTILAASEPINLDTEPVAWAKPVDELVAADLDALASLVGWDAVSRLRVGDGFSTPLAGAASGDGAGPPAAYNPPYSGCEGMSKLVTPAGDERCGEPKDACRCLLRKDHKGAHRCAHGAWRAE